MSIIEFKNFKNLLESEIKKSSNVFIIGHNGPDFDSIGACIGLATLVEHFRKDAYIIVNDKIIKMEPGVKKIIDDNRDQYSFITNEEFLKLKDSKSLLITTDVNKDYLVSVTDYLDEMNSIVVIDHHAEDEHTIKTSKKYITDEASSASEIVSWLLNVFRVKYSPEVANYLLAGICLDTKRFKQNTTSKTHDIAEHLIDKGADIDYVNRLFFEDFESFCRISNLIINGTTIRKYSDDLLSPIQVSFTLDRNHPKEIYNKEDYAKAADRMMKFEGIDGAFALGLVEDDVVHVSARGGKKINVGKIMEAMDGQCGGSNQMAGGRIKTDDIFKVEEELMEKVILGISSEETIIEEPPVIKKKQIKRFNKK